MHRQIGRQPQTYMVLPPDVNIRSTYFSAGAHLQRTGETIAPSSFSCFIALSTSLRSSPLSSAILPAFRGVPASFIVANTCSFTSIIPILIVIVSYLHGICRIIRNCADTSTHRQRRLCALLGSSVLYPEVSWAISYIHCFANITKGLRTSKQKPHFRLRTLAVRMPRLPISAPYGKISWSFSSLFQDFLLPLQLVGEMGSFRPPTPETGKRKNNI